jgi:probable F420-dependent oxidoreductase
MEFGLHLPSAAPGVTAGPILETARAAEDLGYDAVWMFDHLFTPVGIESQYPYSRDGGYPMSPDDPFFDPLGLFGVLAGATQRVKMGTGVLIPTYRHPIVLGKLLATIENFAPGRILLGAGAGWMREEFDAVGVPYQRRGARLEEYIAALRAVWSGSPASFDGELYSWTEAGFLPAPTAPIPVIIGGHSDRALDRAARIGDGWAIATTRGQGRGLAGVTSRLDYLRTRLEAHGRNGDHFELVYQSALWFSDQPNEKLPLTGPPDAIAASLTQLQELGVSMVDLAVFGPAQLIVETAERFQKEVLPLV